MEKIKTLFVRNWETDKLVRDEITPGCEWVIKGEGIATQKIDGTACMIRDGKLFKRYDVKPGRTAPPNFEPCQEADETTGHLPGWVPVTGKPDEKYHLEAFNSPLGKPSRGDGIYELIGPKVNGNPEKCLIHKFVKHGDIALLDVPTSFEGLKKYLSEHDIEGIVWHHPDGRMVKIKGKDFGIKRGTKG